MKRMVAFLAAVCVSISILSATSAAAQTAPPPTDAAQDTVKTDSPDAPAAEPQAAPAAAAPDTAAAGARTRRMRSEDDAMAYVISLGVGSCVNYNPERIQNEFTPAFGAMASFGVRKSGITAGIQLGYNFLLADGTVPNDLNIGTIMAELKYGPLRSKARPYLVVCGGFYRQWIVNLDYVENVIGYGGGAGIDMAIGSTRTMFLDVRYIMGQTREFDETQANTEIIPIRLGISWIIR